MYIYESLIELISFIDKPNRFRCHKILRDHGDKIQKAPGSLTKHQAWGGGYKDHLEETMNFAIQLYKLMQEQRILPFSISDALLVLFLHDIEKPFKYTSQTEILDSETEKWLFLEQIVQKYKFELTDDHWNALKYVHGEGKDFHREKKIQGPLAAFVHICDTVSARIWYDYPKRK